MQPAGGAEAKVHRGCRSEPGRAGLPYPRSAWPLTHLSKKAEAEHRAHGVAPGAVERGEERRALPARHRALQQRAHLPQLRAQTAPEASPSARGVAMHACSGASSSCDCAPELRCRPHERGRAHGAVTGDRADRPW